MNLIKLNASYKDLQNGILRSKNMATTVVAMMEYFVLENNATTA